MKTTIFRLICLTGFLAPMAANSQTNIKSAFDAIIKSPKSEITEKHSLEKNRDTNQKSGQDDIYYFVLPGDKMNLVKNVMAAFDKDKDKAFYVKSGNNGESTSNVVLNSSGFNSITVDDPGCEYIYELFSPSKSEDPRGIYRYAYGFNYKEEDGVIKGKMIVNYSTTSDYRKKKEDDELWERNLQQTIYMKKAQKVSDQDFQQSWFEKVMACINGLKDANSKTRIALATKAYKLVGNMNDFEVTEQDKTTIKNMFNITLQDPAYQDPVLLELLRQCVKGLK